MGRNTSFNRQKVLTEALDLFWARSFSASSMKQLEEVTDLHPGSLYYHFRSKEFLYIEALTHYIQYSFQEKMDRYLTNQSSIKSLRQFFTSGYRHQPEYRFRNCCFIVLSMMEVPLLPNIVREMVEHALGLLQQKLCFCLGKLYQKHPMLRSDKCEFLSHDLVDLYLSLQLRTRVITNQKILDNHVQEALKQVLPLINEV